MEALVALGIPTVVENPEEKINMESNKKSSHKFFWTLIAIFNIFLIFDLFFNDARAFIWFLFTITGGYSG